MDSRKFFQGFYYWQMYPIVSFIFLQGYNAIRTDLGEVKKKNKKLPITYFKILKHDNIHYIFQAYIFNLSKKMRALIANFFAGIVDWKTESP